MLVIQGYRAVNISNCESIKVWGNEIIAVMPSDTFGFYFTDEGSKVVYTTVAVFGSVENAKETFKKMLKAYANGEKVFEC